MNTIMNKIKNWWNNNEKNEKTDNLVRKFLILLDNFARNALRFMFIGIILNVLASYFYPEFPARFPTIYSWFDGWLQFGEFLLTTVLKALYSFFTGIFLEFWHDYIEEFESLLQHFTNWLNSIHF